MGAVGTASGSNATSSNETKFVNDMIKEATSFISADSTPDELLSNSDIQSIVEAYVLQFGGDENAILDRIRNGIDVQLNPPPMAKGKLWNNNDLDNALQYIKARPQMQEQLLSGINNVSDRNAISNVISNGWAESFDKYDSDVAEQFIQQYEKMFKK